MTDSKNINDTIMSLNESDLIHVILYGNKNFDNNMNISILTATIKFIKDSERFDQPLFNCYQNHSYSFIITLFKLFPFSLWGLLYFNLDICFNVLYFSPYCLHMISRVLFLYCFILNIYLYFISMSNC